MTTPTSFDITYECGFDGELGSIMSVDAHGHLDHDAAELFLAGEVCRELEDAGVEEPFTFGLEVEHLWRSEHPLAIDPDDLDDGYEDRWTYRYTTEEREGAVPVTRFQIASPWSREAVSPTADRAERDRLTGELTTDGVDSWPLLCIHHPDEPAVVAISSERFIDPAPEHVIDGSVHYCAPCHQDFNARMKVAFEKTWAPLRAENFLQAYSEEIIAVSSTHQLRRQDLADVLAGADSDGGARHRLTDFADASEAMVAEGPIATAPGFHTLRVTDIRHLVEDYTHRSA